MSGFPNVEDYEWGPAGGAPPESFRLPQVPPWLGRAIRWALDARRLVWPILFGLPGQDDDEVNTRNLYSDGIKFWDNFWSLSLINFALYPGDLGLFTWESPYMVLGGSGLTRSIVEQGWSDTAPVFFSGFNLFLGPLLGQSSNTALTRVRLFPSLGLDRLGVPPPPEAPPGYAPRPSFVPPGFMGFSPFVFNLFDRSFFALVEDALGSL